MVCVINYILNLYDVNRDHFKNIPDELNEKNSILKYFTFNNKSDTIFLILGDLNENDRICIIDANKNYDFSDDYRYVYNRYTISSEIIELNGEE